MSKFDFLEEMFFGRTEKSGRKYRFYCRTENAAENNGLYTIFEKSFGLFWTNIWTNIWTFLVLALLARLNIVIEPSQEI
jgi:hypothetical protein